MYVLQTLYALVLASTNLAMGWLLYHLSEPALGVILGFTGLLVILALIEGTLTKHGIHRRKST